MRIPQIREAMSWVPVRLKPSRGGKQLSVATGFFYEHNGRTFLVTNYRIVFYR